MLEDALVAAGHTVIGVASGSAVALRLVEQTKPDLAIVDIDLGDGPSSIALAKQLKDGFGVPTLFATGQPAVARDHSEAVLGLIGKPFSPMAITRCVDAVHLILRGQALANPPPELELFSARC